VNQMNIKPTRNAVRSACRAFSLAEVVIALMIAVLLMVGIVLGFIESTQNAEWGSYNLAAQSLANQGLEQARAATWDPQAPTPIDLCNQTNFPNQTNLLDVPISGNNFTYATTSWTITVVATNPYPLKMIRVDTTWPFVKPGISSKVFTNTIATFRAPNQ